ncbi:MAG: hypothetical protein HDR01_01465 [Lachnospiraceae bacterium]|nr:hypothetical protein [Lachnospiraceae bacterium]
MKRIIMMSMLLFNGCGISLEDEKCDEYLEKGVSALENKDKEEFTSLFWEKALEDYSESNWEIVIGDMMAIWQGSLESYEMQSKEVKTDISQTTYIRCVYNNYGDKIRYNSYQSGR